MARQRPGAAAALPNATDNFIENWAWNGTFSEHFKGAHKEIENIVTTARRPKGASLCRDGVHESFEKSTLLDAFAEQFIIIFAFLMSWRMLDRRLDFFNEY